MRTPLSLNEIKDLALTFSKNWENVESERAEAQTFWNEFFELFGISRRRFAQFEVVSSTDKRNGFSSKKKKFFKTEIKRCLKFIIAKEFDKELLN